MHKSGEDMNSYGTTDVTPNLPTNIVDFRGFDSSVLLILRGGILRSIGNFPEILSQAMLVGIMLVGKLGVLLLLLLSSLYNLCIALLAIITICIVVINSNTATIM